MTDWRSLKPDTLMWMEFLGGFTPTSRPESVELKGSTYDSDSGEHGKTYITSTELRDLACACMEAAHWLDQRRAAAAMAGEKGQG